MKPELIENKLFNGYICDFFDTIKLSHINTLDSLNNIFLDKLIEFHKLRLGKSVPVSEYQFDYRIFVNYIDRKHSSAEIVQLVNHIVDNKILHMYDDIKNYYWFVLSELDRSKLMNWVKWVLEENFDFDFFTNVVNSSINPNLEISSDLWTLLKEYCARESRHSRCPECLTQIGFWCFINLIDRSDYSSYFGSNMLFDFFYDFNKFDYEKFDVSWLLEFDDSILSCISNNDYIKSYVRPLIVRSLQNGVIKRERERLNHILINYFC
jgi:hypothetical protein